jgi:hypothetical protein
MDKLSPGNAFSMGGRIYTVYPSHTAGQVFAIKNPLCKLTVDGEPVIRVESLEEFVIVDAEFRQQHLHATKTLLEGAPWNAASGDAVWWWVLRMRMQLLTRSARDSWVYGVLQDAAFTVLSRYLRGGIRGICSWNDLALLHRDRAVYRVAAVMDTIVKARQVEILAICMNDLASHELENRFLLS